jgi:hypothetical protein
MNFKLVSGIAFSVAALAAGLGTPTTAHAHMVKAPCDFVTSGGFVFKDNGVMANFAADGGCKNGDFWGKVNFVDHETGYHLNSTRITGYLWDPKVPNARDICGWARVNDSSYEEQFRVRVIDNGEPGRDDQFGIIVDNTHSSGDRFYLVSTRSLGGNKNGGGNVQLHKSNPSTTAGPGFFDLQEWQMCGDLNTPDAPF